MIDPVHRAYQITRMARGTVDTMDAEVCHGLADADRSGRELARDAVEDAGAGTRPG